MQLCGEHVWLWTEHRGGAIDENTVGLRKEFALKSNTNIIVRKCIPRLPSYYLIVILIFG